MKLRHWINIASSVLVILVAAACGKSGESFSPLDAAQKNKFRETVESVGRASLAATSAGKGMSRVPWSIASDGARTRMVDRLKTALSQRQCRFSEQAPVKLEGKEPKTDPPGLKAEARRLTRVRFLRYYPLRIRDGIIEVAVPRG